MHKEQEEMEINTRFFNYFINKKEEYENESSQDDYSFISSSSYFNGSTLISSNNEEDNKIPSSIFSFNSSEESLMNIKNISEILKVSHPGKDSLFTRIENDPPKEEIFCQRKRYNEKRRRLENHDNIRKKLKRGFFNRGVISKLNAKLKNNGSDSLFEKFQQYFVNDVTRRTNKELMNMTFEEIFEKKELYQESELKNYEHNFNLVKSKEIQENKELKNILIKKLYIIYEDYLNSKEFLIDEINLLRNKNMTNEYIERYKYLAKHFIEFVLS